MNTPSKAWDGPTRVAAAAATVAVCVVGYVASMFIANKGLVPPATALKEFVCTGYPIPVRLEFRHGMDVVKLHTDTLHLQGTLLNGDIEWRLDAAAPLPAVSLPQAIVYDDIHTLKLRDQAQTEHLCQR